MEEMERLGIVYRTGVVIGGAPQWDLTALGRAVEIEEDGAVPALERAEKRGMVRRTGGKPQWALTKLGRTPHGH